MGSTFIADLVELIEQELKQNNDYQKGFIIVGQS